MSTVVPGGKGADRPISQPTALPYEPDEIPSYEWLSTKIVRSRKPFGIELIKSQTRKKLSYYAFSSQHSASGDQPVGQEYASNRKSGRWRDCHVVETTIPPRIGISQDSGDRWAEARDKSGAEAAVNFKLDVKENVAQPTGGQNRDGEGNGGHNNGGQKNTDAGQRADRRTGGPADRSSSASR